MKKIAIIPAYNERDSIVKTVKDLKEKAPGFDYVIINDCSSDDTLELCRQQGLNVLNLPINLGIGGAVQTGYLYAYHNDYDIAVQFDGDGQHDAEYLEMMSEILEKEEMDMVIGSRFITKEGFQSSGLRRVGIRYFTFLTRLLFGQGITDATSGMRMCNRKVMELFIKDYPRDYPEPESVSRLLRHKYKIKEVPVIMHERKAGVSSISLRKSGYYMIKVSLAVLIERLR
ncbi:glycosyltransferase family 2 protein [Anaerotruncus sp. 1XD22-93]|nr:glycosyltransferase family 2 protein [Lachnospiraceae bacterium]NBI74119.1 glycosyltransferase family 2 protein [Lachnospiraceae bacterium]RKK00173.1 glycosyltransferase family 2 protein [Anaerotruncus sp. 1XD22-93]